jgi:hypothetical protein
MSFDFNKAKLGTSSEPKPVIESTKTEPQGIKPLALQLSVTKLGGEVSSTPSAIQSATPSAISGDLGILDNLPTTLTYKEQLAEVPDLDELAKEFNNPDQPELFDDAALAAVHKACLQLESAIDNADNVREQLTFIMTELRKYPETAAKIWDSDTATMVRALRHSYNVVAFAKEATKKKKEESKSKVKEQLAAADAMGLFDGLDI